MSAARHVYLVRHGEAKSELEDPGRPLNDKGRAEVERVAAWAARARLRVDEIRHSGKARARETAEILARRIGVAAVAAAPGLDPNDDVRPLAKKLQTESRSILIAGHLPFLGLLASWLLVGHPDRDVFRFPTGALLGLAREGDAWSVACAVAPDHLP